MKLQIIIDSTGSMDIWIQNLKTYLFEVLQLSSIIGFTHFNIISYKDYDKLEVVKRSPTYTVKDMERLLECNILEGGGGGYCEAFKTALLSAIDNTDMETFVVHISDSTPHNDEKFTVLPECKHGINKLKDTMPTLHDYNKSKHCKLDREGMKEKRILKEKFVVNNLIELCNNKNVHVININTTVDYIGIKISKDTNGEVYILKEFNENILIDVILSWTLSNHYPTIVNNAKNIIINNHVLIIIKNIIEKNIMILAKNVYLGSIYRRIIANQTNGVEQLFETHRKTLCKDDNDSLQTWLNISYDDSNIIYNTITSQSFDTILSYSKDNNDKFEQYKMHNLIHSCKCIDMIIVKQLFSRLSIRKGHALRKHEVPIQDNDKMFSLLLHSICPGTYIENIADKANIALLARKTVVKDMCTDYLMSIKGQWFEVRKDISIDYVNLLIGNKDILLDEEYDIAMMIKRMNEYYNLYNTLIDIEYYDNNSCDGYRKEHMRICCHCKLLMPNSLINGILCANCINLCNHDSNVDFYNHETGDNCYMSKCYHCKSLYCRAEHTNYITGKNMCYDCKDGANLCRSKCDTCNETYVGSDFYQTCANCSTGHKFEKTIMKKRVKLSQLVSKMNLMEMLGYTCSNMSSLYTIYKSHKKYKKFIPKFKYKQFEILNNENIAEQIFTCVQHGYYNYDCCDICSLENNLTDSCGQENCDTRLCNTCAMQWYGENKKGCVINLRKMTCMFCNREPLFKIIKKYGSDNIETVQKLPEIDNNVIYAWCISCNGIKECGTRECANELPTFTNYTCTECIEKKSDVSKFIKNCPYCEHPTYLVSGCSHITCICGAHWCFVCGKEFTSATIYEHMQREHGGYWHNRAYDGDDDYYRGGQPQMQYGGYNGDY